MFFFYPCSNKGPIQVRTFIGGHDIAIGLHLSDTIRRFQALTTTGLSGRLEGVEEMPSVQGFESRGNDMELFEEFEVRFVGVAQAGYGAGCKVLGIGLREEGVQSSLFFVNCR